MEVMKSSVNRKVNVLVMFAVAALGTLLLLSCMDKAEAVDNPPGYDLNKPVKYNMPASLTEVSGITFNNGKSDIIYAEEDERGRVYYFKPGDNNLKHSVFASGGDYEDLAILGQQVIVLRSDGTLFTFPVSALGPPQISGTKTQSGLLPAGEYEGMYADNKTGQLYVLCKHCAEDKKEDSTSGSIFKQGADGTLKQSGTFRINLQGLENTSGKKKKKNKVSFHPSALAKNQATNEWYILSSVNKMIMVTDAAFKVKATYAIDPSLFLQPEGIAFDNQNNLYISNEGDKVTPGTILKFSYKK